MVTSEQTLTSKQLETLCINTIRTLAMDAVQQANSGHRGAPMALAPVMYCLWQNFLRYDPADPVWPNRDRFVLSNGHASMLLYATLYLAQVRGINPEYERLGDYAITLDDIKRFRQIDSRTPGHPEYRIAGASRRQPDRSAREWATAWEWLSLRTGRQRTTTVPALRFLITTSTPCAAMAT